MKKAIILALLPVFLYSIIGWQWVFGLRLYSHQVKEWTAFFDEEELEVIALNPDDLKSHDSFLVNDHELFHHGKYFDIKYKKRRGDEIVFYCHPDNEEDGLYTSFDTQIKDASGMTSCSKQKLLKVVKVSVFENDPGSILFGQEKICDMDFPYSTPLRTFLQGNSVFVPPDAYALIS